MNKPQRDKYWPQLVERDGSDLCMRCGKTGEIIHHVNGDDRDNRLENMVILCWSCNKLKSLQKRYLPVSRRDYTPEHKKNLIKEPLFAKWLQGKLSENNDHYPYDYVIDEGAYFCNLSVETIKRYLSKLSDHPSSPYVTKAGTFGEMEVWVKGKEPQLD